MSELVLGIDLGSSGSKAVIMDQSGQVRGYAYRPLARIYVRPGWVEQSPQAVAASGAEAITAALDAAAVAPAEIAACGIAGQRNTAFAWDSHTGQPLANAITWQDQRTRPLLDELKSWPQFSQAQRRLGYPPGLYMAALHLAWCLRHDQHIINAAESGRLRLGLSPAWLVTALGQPYGHHMDASLVQAQGLYDFRAMAYWQEWLDRLGIPLAALPLVAPTVHDFGRLHISDSCGRTADVPVLAMIGDQQAALFGSNCRRPGAAECTHGTASYLKAFLGQSRPELSRLNVYCAWNLNEQRESNDPADGTDAGQQYCLEAATSVTGAAIRWMRDQVGLFASEQALDAEAGRVGDSGGLVFVPAFAGLELPFEPEARGTLLGLTLGHNRGHIARAFLEAIGFQMRMILEAVRDEAGLEVDELLVGGGLSASDLACQIQADLLNRPILRPSFTDTTAWAAGLLAGLGCGLWPDSENLPPLPGERALFQPRLSADQRDAGYARWLAAVDLVCAWGQGSKGRSSAPFSGPLQQDEA